MTGLLKDGGVTKNQESFEKIYNHGPMNNFKEGNYFQLLQSTIEENFHCCTELFSLIYVKDLSGNAVGKSKTMHVPEN